MVVSLDYYIRVPSPASPGARGLRPGGSDTCLVVPSPCDARTPLQAHHALNANTGNTPFTAEKGSNEDEDPDAASAGSPSSLARVLFNSDGLDTFLGQMDLLVSEVRAIHGGRVSMRARAPRDGAGTRNLTRVSLSRRGRAGPSRRRPPSRRQSPRCVATRGCRVACEGAG